jgi:diguanylate cyclase (GGDEF)-like protein
MAKNIIIGQSGGPTAVINSSLAGVYKAARSLGADKVYGMKYGIEGLLKEELLELNRQLQELSRRDGLTGVGNRLLFTQRLTEDWARALRTQQPLSLILLDIDFFKQYNDCYGHLQGDACLQQIAGALARLPLRSTDLFARYGGEEFAVLLPETALDKAIEVAERLRARIEKTRFANISFNSTCH